MQIAGHARPFVDSRFHLRIEMLRDLMKAVPVQAPEQYQKSGQARRLEPTSLIVCRGDGKIEGGAGLIPHAAVIAGHHTEAVIAWSKIVIERLPSIAGVLPVRISAFQSVPEAGRLRRREAERGIVDLQIADQRGQTQI